MQDLFARSQLRVEGNSRRIAEICLHENNVGATRCRDLLEFYDQRCCDALAPVRCCDSEIVDVDLAALLLELLQLVGRDAAHNRAAFQRGKRDETVATE